MNQAPPPPSMRWALFLDVDGTLLDIAVTPDAVEVPRKLPSLLSEIYDRLRGAVALISGRSIENLDALFRPLRLPAAGQHGAELRLALDGSVMRYPRPSHLEAASARLSAVAEECPGVLIEDKGRSIAAHFRAVPHYGLRVEQVMLEVVREHADLELMPARMAFEIRPTAVDKGMAIDWFMRTTLFSDRVPVFLGDDITDEDGFAAVSSLGGHAIRVGPIVHGKAAFRLENPTAVRTWLAAVEEALSAIERDCA